MNRRPIASATTALIAVATLVVGTWLIYRTPGALVNEAPQRMGPTPQPDAIVVVHIDEGAGAADAGEVLEEAGVLESARAFRVLAALMGVGQRLAPGDYELHKGMSVVTAVQRISQGITASNVVTIREGLRSEEIGALLEERGVTSAAEFQAALSDSYEEPFLEAFGGLGLEGVLFPASYGFARGTTAHQAIAQMVHAFQQRYEESIEPKLAAAPNGLSLREVVTLASIVEREAQVADERPIIASVFLNRLNQGIPLQADPTVQYALGSDPASITEFGYWKAELSLADLAIDSPYNTYANAGLPPGPISNPGLDSILAVLEPAQTDYLYFVARADGSHAFADTLEEHQQHVCEVDPSRPEC